MEVTEEQIRQQAEECYARKIRQAQRMSPMQRFLAGAELFEDACQITLAGIRHQYPHWSNDECRAHLEERLFGTRARP